MKGWQNLRLEEEALPDAFTARNGNVGLVLGEPSGWLVDVDLDCPEAIELAKKYLPATGAITGRSGRENSHWWYICEGCETARYRDDQRDTDATTVELRSTGLQTVVGPSTHPDGSIYEVLTGEPARVPAALLQLAVEGLHKAVLKERGHDERRHEQQDCRNISTGEPVSATQHRGVCDVQRSRPGDDYNQRGDLHALLMQHGWKVTGKNGNNIQLTRPGKTTGEDRASELGKAYQEWISVCFSVESAIMSHLQHRAKILTLRAARKGWGGHPKKPEIQNQKFR
jgi:hypothetical protein